MWCLVVWWNRDNRGTSSIYGEDRPNKVEDSGHGYCGSWNTCVMVGNTTHESSGLGADGWVDKIMVPSHHQIWIGQLIQGHWTSPTTILFFLWCWTSKNIPWAQSVHQFIHTMDMVPRVWYIQEEVKRKMMDWTHMSSQFFLKSIFMEGNLAQRAALLYIKYFVFPRHPKEATYRVVCSYHRWVEKMKEDIHFWKVDVNDIDDDDPRGI